MPRFSFKYIVVLFVLGTFSVFGQDEISPEHQQLLLKSEDGNLSLEERIKWANQLKVEGEKTKDTVLLIEANFSMAKIYYENGKYLESLEFLNHLLSLERDINSHNYAFFQNKFGQNYYQLGINNKALHHFEEAKRVALLIDNHFLALSCANNIASVYISHEEYTKAIEQLKEVIEITKENEILTVSAYYNLAICYLHLDDLNNAHLYLKEHVETSLLQENKDQLLMGYGKLAIVFAKKGDELLSNEYLDKSSSLIDSVRFATKIRYHLDEASVYIQFEQDVAAKEKLELIEELIKNSELTREKLKLYKVYGDYFELTENLEQYIAYNTLHNQIADSLRLSQSLNEYEAYEKLSKAEKKNHQLLVDQQQLQIDSEKQSKQIVTYERNMYRVITWCIIGAILLTIILFYFRKRMIQAKISSELMERKADQLSSTLEVKKDQLTELAIYMSQNKKLLSKLRDELRNIRRTDSKHKSELDTLIFQITEVMNISKDQQKFHELIEDVNEEFISRLKSKYPELTNNEIRLISLIKLNLSSKEIASLSNISSKSVDVSRYRLRKKLGLEKGTSLKSLIS